MPILKQLVAGPSRSKRHSRVDLTVEMISAPLADFRHTMHVGRGGDAFGDTSFLSAPPEPIIQVQKNSLLPRRLRGSKRPQSERNSSYIPAANSTISLPHARDWDVTLRRPQSASVEFLETDRRSAVMGGWSLEETERRFGEPSELPAFTPPPSRGMKPAESMLSFHIDLGPSMLGDVLGVMDQSEQLQQNLAVDQEQDSKALSRLENGSTFSPGVTDEETERWSPTYSANFEDSDFMFMDEDEDEIRV